ncbi:hypothetical protein MKX03_007001, partial [Papaver bracteatum]
VELPQNLTQSSNNYYWSRLCGTPIKHRWWLDARYGDSVCGAKESKMRVVHRYQMFIDTKDHEVLSGIQMGRYCQLVVIAGKIN